MTERAWVLQSDSGNFYKGEGYMCEYINNAWSGGSSKHAQRVAQFARQNYGTRVPFLYAIPIERETVRTVEEIEGPAELYVLHDGEDYFSAEGGKCRHLSRARVFDAFELLRTHNDRHRYDGYAPIPVRVTKEPGEWREVKE